MALTPDDISRIKRLARLELAPSESERMLTQINGFFAIVEEMRAVRTDGVEPLAHPAGVAMDVVLRLREDVISGVNDRDANQQSAPEIARGLYLVPKVVE